MHNHPQLFDGSFVTPNSFEFLGVKPFIGRWITPEDGNPGSPPVFAMSYRLWSKQFNRDPKILGTTMSLNGVPRTLVGTMPARFLLNDSDIWIPFSLSRGEISSGKPAAASIKFSTNNCLISPRLAPTDLRIAISLSRTDCAFPSKFRKS
ncbi:MAG: ABC transporter permease [Candidatus Acidiferrales bacterium]